MEKTPISPLGEGDTEVIALVVNGQLWGLYEGLAGTFASFAYACLAKNTLPGYAAEDILAGADRAGRRLTLTIRGRRSREELAAVMDKALVNIVAFPGGKGEACCVIEAAAET
ncbi:MAG TPA: hypothetical protein P5269_05250 [Syntrophales bacterium]|nr:hypothetical protein [Syntrophales bacterium]HOM06237.1 hypothetical protein [Syntrophales bacterium]HON99323.1 hypothetical protein [Syntrophales bacterium]HPQ05781.1 hypothetical protein [Syntrophales bacterium]HRS87025.1 hypothetical protein [Syntrophales bacterium]